MARAKLQKNQMMTILTLFLLGSSLAYYASALPVQPSITEIKNETSSAVGIGAPRAGDPGGYIYTLALNTTQQNSRWKAYVGNVTGALVLEDTDGFSIYEWGMSLNSTGNVFISRNDTVDWAGGINCSNQSEKESEDTFLNINSSQSNSINRTFNSSVHKSFTVSGTPYTNSTCFAIATYLNDSAQTFNATANETAEIFKFQEVILSDTSSNFVYMAMLEQDKAGFDNGVYDFQAIIAEDETAGTPTTYYFYVELEA